jgi:hypothetical protein
LSGESARRKAATYTQNSTKQNKRRKTSIPGLGFEPTTPVFELAKTVQALERAAAVLGLFYISLGKIPNGVFFFTVY